MSSQLKMLKRIQKARERMRDVAAAEVALAEQERLRCDAERIENEEERKSIVEQAATKLGQATGISDLEMVTIDMAGADELVDEASKRLHKASVARGLAAQELRAKERAVRLSEELVSRSKEEIRKSADKAEQAMIDDIVASRWSNK